MIDFPQAVDPKLNSHAQDFLTRDVQRLGSWLDRAGFHQPWEAIAGDLWTGWLHADLVPDDLR